MSGKIAASPPARGGNHWDASTVKPVPYPEYPGWNDYDDQHFQHQFDCHGYLAGREYQWMANL